MITLEKRIKKSYIWGTLAVIAFLSFSFISLSQLITQQKNDSKLINVAGKQRMLVQKVALHIYSYQENFGRKSTSEEKRALISLATNMYNEHLFLVNNTDALSIKVRSLYFDPQELLHKQIKLFTNNAIAITEFENKNEVLTFSDNNFSSESVEQLLASVNFVVDQMERYSTESLYAIEHRIFVFWIAITLSLVIILLYVFKHLNAFIKNRAIEIEKAAQQESDFEFAMNQYSIVYRLTPDQKISYVNDNFCDFFSLDRSIILNRHYQDLALSAHNFEELIHDESFHKGVKKVSKHELAYTVNGTTEWLETTIIPISKNGDIVHFMIIQNEITEQRMINVALKEVYRTVTNNIALADKVDRILTIGCDFLKLSNGIVSHINKDEYTVKYVVSLKSIIQEGDQLSFPNTYCANTFFSSEPIAFHHIKYSPLNESLCYKKYGLESYIGCAIMVDDAPYGTLNFSCMSPQHQAFTNNQIDFIALLAKWLGLAISQEAQKEKILSQQRLMEKMSEQAKIGAWEYDLISNEITWSDMTRKIHEAEPGYQPDIDSAINFYKGEENQNRIRALLEELLKGGKAFQVEMELETAKGNSIWVCSHGEAIFENNECVKIYGSFQDITAKHNIDIVMADNNRRIKLATDSSSIGIWEYNIITQELVWDELMFRLYEVKKKDFKHDKDTLIQYVHPEDADRIEYELQLAINDKKKFNTQFRIITPNNRERYIKASAIVLRNFNGVPQTIIGVNYDITESVKSEQALIEAKEIAEQASKIKNEFLASMSHEIRTPMNGVLGMLDLVSDSQLTKEQQQQISIAQSSASFLLHIINDILDFSKIDANQLTLERIKFDLRLLIEDIVISMIHQAKEKNIEVMLDTIELEETEVIGDPNRIRQILINLLGNAIKFTTEGDITVKASLVSDGAENWRLLLSVQDTGIGIPADKHAVIFDNFAQVDSSTTRYFGGTGLGLAIVKRLCECMNGGITLESEANKGSMFTCDIEVQKIEKLSCILPPSYFKQLSVLIISTHTISQNILSKQCTQWGVNVRVVNSLNSGIELCELNYQQNINTAQFDLILIDTNAINGNNLENLIAFNQDKRFKTIAWVIMTSSNQKEIKEQLIAINYISCLVKPMTYMDFYSILCSFANRDVNNKKHLMVESHTSKFNSVKQLLSHQFQLPKNTRVLLAEDNKVNQMIMKGLFKKLSLTCDIAVTGVEVLDMLNNSDVHYDMVFMDCQMPEMDGYQATQEIRASLTEKYYCNIPIVAMTANAMPGDKEKCLNAGMDDYLSKPIDTNKFFSIVEHWLVKS